MSKLALFFLCFGVFHTGTVSPQKQIDSVCDVDAETILFDDERLERLRATFFSDGGCYAVDWKSRFNAAVQQLLRPERNVDYLSGKDMRILADLRRFEMRSRVTPKRQTSSAFDQSQDADLVFMDYDSSSRTPGAPANVRRPLGRPPFRGRTTGRLSTPGPPTWATPPSPCERRCPNTPEYNPVCGSDDVTYRNPGGIRCARSCAKDVSLRFYGTCVSTTSRPLTPITSSSINLV